MCKSEGNGTVRNTFSLRDNINDVHTVEKLPKCETVTLKTEWGSSVKFQIDNGASVNIIPLSVYQKASKYYKNEKIKESKTKNITKFGGKVWNIKGEVIIRVHRRTKNCQIRLVIVDGDKFHSILGRAAIIELKCIKRFNNDEFYKVNQIEE